MPICEVMQLPCTELDMWALVFEEEYYELHPEEKRKKELQSEEEQILRFKNLMK